ncbi:hypothetical protein Mmc1_2263 [Magnetococcus marinus MC-1]|uniref:Uncharacterized protein n=1 Tax=Magnetococcus marinus (strain ATCC BAA-1437 / JCM 17883 / MC-1) TaxID=156889 RepID=A0L9X1_MAGMM|nr:hypothetical protein Mmc1_2263 [Magnetococcus marinus MC-1]
MQSVDFLFSVTSMQAIICCGPAGYTNRRGDQYQAQEQFTTRYGRCATTRHATRYPKHFHRTHLGRASHMCPRVMPANRPVARPRKVR